MLFRQNFFILVVAVLLIPLTAFSEVNPKNGGFYITYTDLLISGGDHDLSITRTYNSKSKERGWFGVGWGTPYETKVVVSGDGSLFVIENGSGAQRRFVPKESLSIEEAVKKIIDTGKAKKDFISDSFIKTLTSQLKNNSELRLQYFKKYNIEAKIPDGATLYSEGVELQTLTKDKDGYHRTFSDGKIEYFDNSGRLIKLADKFDYFVEVDYKNGQPSAIRNSQGTQISLEWNTHKTIKAATSTGDKKATYTYSDKDDLIESTDVNGENYKYTYNIHHNLTAINYEDKTSLQIKYNKEASVNELTEKNGDVATYKYEKDLKNADLHYWTIISKQYKKAKKLTSRFEYEMKTKLDGQQYLYRTYTEIFGIKTETIYSECCSLPVKITQNDNVTTLDYNSQGKLVKKVSKDQTLQFEYDPKTNKVSKFISGDEWMKFDYDKKNNLAKVEKNDGRVLLMNHNRLGQVVKLQDQNKNEKRTFSVNYDAVGRPVMIDLSNVGVVQVSYDGNGEVKEMKSSGGEKVALAVYDAFQAIVNLLRPAGVALSN